MGISETLLQGQVCHLCEARDTPPPQASVDSSVKEETRVGTGNVELLDTLFLTGRIP